MDQLKLAGQQPPLAAQAAGGAAALQQVAILPVILFLVFGAIYLYDRSRGGYQQEFLKSLEQPVEEIYPADA